MNISSDNLVIVFTGDKRFGLVDIGLSDLVSNTTVSLHAACFLLVPGLVHSRTVVMEAVLSSETSANFHRTKLRHIPESIALLGYPCEDLRFNTVCFLRSSGSGTGSTQPREDN
jgi:hypothetical protein